MMDLFAQFFQHSWGEGGALHKVSLEFTKFYGLRAPRCSAGPNIVGSCYIRLHTSANTDATTPNMVGR